MHLSGFDRFAKDNKKNEIQKIPGRKNQIKFFKKEGEDNA